MGKNPKIRFVLPLVEDDVPNLDDRIYALFETKLLSSAATQRGMTIAEVLDGSNIRADQLEDASVRISARQRLRVYQNIQAKCADPTIFLSAGNSATVCSFGVWGYVLLSSSTFMEAIYIAFKYLKLTGPLIRKTFDVKDGEASYQAEDTLVLGPLLQPVLDFWFAFIAKLSNEVSQRAFELKFVELTYPAPAGKDFYQEFFECPVSFNAAKNRVIFDAGILAMELPRADSLSFQICDEMCAAMMQEMRSVSGPARQVRDLILYTPSYFPTFEEIAGQLFTTPRTLRRRLADQGTSYQQILNDVRKNLSIKFLRETNLSMEEIAERVGFSDSRNFRHAFKKWTDTTPSSHRVRH